MKRTLLFFAAAAMTIAASAQTVTGSKSTDNFYIGINGGASTMTTKHSWMQNLNPNAGLRIGRYFTPVFGLAAESNAYFGNKPMASTGTAVKYVNTSLLGTINLTNWFGGYPGEPRAVELIGIYGLGWGHLFGNNKFYNSINHDNLTSKAGFDLAFNFGSDKQCQFYIEPAIIWGLNGDGRQPIEYNINKSMVQLNAGLVFKLGNSNGSHNFTIAQLHDQAEIDGLNAEINNLRSAINGKDAQLSEKDRRISSLERQLSDCMKKPKYVKPATATNLQPTVLFRQGQAVIDPAQYAPIELIATYMKKNPAAKVEIKGYASPEGSAEINQKLSERRAEVVKEALINKYKISADRLTTKGMGATDKLFEQVEFNRVSTFNDNTKGN